MVVPEAVAAGGPTYDIPVAVLDATGLRALGLGNDEHRKRQRC
jgi:hypothetical protein